jgi:hypothetical protein
MPTAVDPSLNGGGVPITHSPLSRISTTAVTDFDLVKFLQEMLTALPHAIETLLFPAIKSLTGIDLSVFLPLLNLLHFDFSSPTAFLKSLIDALLSIAGGLLGFNSPLNAENLFNQVASGLMGLIPFSHIGEAPKANLVTDPDFLDASVIDGWGHDPTGGFNGTGTRYVTADGATHELLGNLIGVSVGQVLSLGVKARWNGLVGTGTPVALAVTGYNDVGDAMDQKTVAAHNTTPTTTDFIDLTGPYTVPAGVSGLRTRLSVASAATAGTVYFSHVTVSKTQTIFQRLIAGQNPGEVLTDDISHLFGGIIQNTLDILNKAAQGDFDHLVSTIAGDFGNTISDVADRLLSFLDGASPLNGSNIASGNIVDDFVGGIGTIVNNIFGSLFGVPSTNATHEDAATALQANAMASTDHGAGITNMFARLSNLESKVSALPVSGGGTGVGTADGGAVGVIDTDTFERVDPVSLGSTWLTTYSGGAGIWALTNGHDAEFSPSGVADREFLCIRNNPDILRSQTDYQRVTSELSSASTRLYIPFVIDINGYDDIWLRVSDDTTSLANITGVRIRYGADGSLSIYRFVNGAGTELKSLAVADYIVPPGPGANLIGEAGVLLDGAVRTFRAKIGASIRLAVSEIGTASGLGPTCRRWGHGGKATGFTVPFVTAGQTPPGGLHYWNGMDQTR